MPIFARPSLLSLITYSADSHSFIPHPHSATYFSCLRLASFSQSIRKNVNSPFFLPFFPFQNLQNADLGLFLSTFYTYPISVLFFWCVWNERKYPSNLLFYKHLRPKLAFVAGVEFVERGSVSVCAQHAQNLQKRHPDIYI